MGGCMGGTLIPRVHTLIITVQTLVLNDVTSARWQRTYPGYFGFIFVQWVEVVWLGLRLCLFPIYRARAVYEQTGMDS